MLFEKLQLEDDETIIAIIHKHWWLVLRQLMLLIALSLVPLCVPLVVSFTSFFPDKTLHTALIGIYTNYALALSFLYCVWLLLLWMISANFWTDYSLDLWAITSKRVILVDQRGFFDRFISSFRLERLQDMNIEIRGIIPTLLDFGTIEAQTAGGSNEKFIGYDMPHPRDIKAQIVEAADTLAQQERTASSSL